MTATFLAALAGARHRQQARPIDVTVTSTGDEDRRMFTARASSFGTPYQSRSLEAGGFAQEADAVVRFIRADLPWTPALGHVVALADGRQFRITAVRDDPREPEAAFGLKAKDI